MKKIFALVVLLAAATACSTEPPATPTATNANMAPATKATVALTEADAIAKEKATWEALTKKDYETFGNDLNSDYVEIGSEGIYDKPGILAYLKELTLTETTFSDWKYLTIDKDAVIVTYQVNIKGTFKGEAIPAGPYRASSVWVNRDGKWQAIFYQETLAKAAPATPPAAASPAAKTTASPAAKAADMAAGPDAEANEKMVWDTFKTKDFDGFASMLAADFVEIEADGFYDKAGAVKSVSGMPAGAKFELSEWKTTKFDNDASLVTYLVTTPGPKPMKERHSTIWVNRAGKWSALFHQGTPVEAAAPAKAAKPAM